MAEFTPINTQEEFDAAIKPRLERERATISKKYEDYDQIKSERDSFASQIADFEKSAKENTDKITDLQNQLDVATKKASSLEVENLKTQIAIDKGLPMELRGRLNGATKEELEKDAESLKEIFKKENQKNLPGFQPFSGDSDDYESTGKVNKDRAMQKFEKSLKIINEQ